MSTPVKSLAKPVSARQVTMELEVISPAMAEEMLGHNTHNRHLQPYVVDNYARQMVNGSWVANGDAIRFAHDGTLLDGQHRLAAILKAGVPVATWVGRGFPLEVQTTIDAGRKRTAGDVLSLNGFVEGNKLAAAVRMVHNWDAGERGMYSFGTTAKGSLSSREILDILREDTDGLFPQAISQSSRNGIRQMVTGRSAATLYVLASRISPDAADKFFDRLASDVEHREGSPILALRRHWSRLTDQRTHKAAPGVYLMGGVRCWNAWVQNRTLNQVAYKDTNIPELAKPKIKGSN